MREGAPDQWTLRGSPVENARLQSRRRTDPLYIPQPRVSIDSLRLVGSVGAPSQTHTPLAEGDLDPFRTHRSTDVEAYRAENPVFMVSADRLFATTRGRQTSPRCHNSTRACLESQVHSKPIHTIDTYSDQILFCNIKTGSQGDSRRVTWPTIHDVEQLFVDPFWRPIVEQTSSSHTWCRSH